MPINVVWKQALRAIKHEAARIGRSVVRDYQAITNAGELELDPADSLVELLAAGLASDNPRATLAATLPPATWRSLRRALPAVLRAAVRDLAAARGPTSDGGTAITRAEARSLAVSIVVVLAREIFAAHPEQGPPPDFDEVAARLVEPEPEIVAEVTEAAPPKGAQKPKKSTTKRPKTKVTPRKAKGGP